MNLRRVNIGTRLAGCFGVILLSVAVMLLATLLSNDRSRDHLLDTLQHSAARQQVAEDMRHSLMTSAVAVRNMGLQTEMDGVHKDEAAAKKARAAYLAAKARLEAGDLSEDEKALLVRLADIDRQMEVCFKEAVELASLFMTEQAGGVITRKIDPLLGKALVELAAFIDLQKQHTAVATAQAVELARLTRWAAMGIGVLLMMAVAAMAWRITASITRPLRMAMEVSARVARGELAFDIEVTGRDEPALLLAGLRDMRNHLRTMVSEVRVGADTLAGVSVEIARGNADLSARTESQASALEQTASNVEELTSIVKRNAQSAHEAQGLSRNAAEQTENGHALVQQVVATMSAIDESSRRIGDITSVINGIAFQTNILALNAAVEAARAGEHGRGFAVVASEVRVLSQRTTDAARQIEGLIASAVERSGAGSLLVDKAGRAMNGVTESVRKVAEIVGAISQAGQEQLSGMEQLSSAVGDIDRGTQQNSAMVEEVSAASDTMREQTRQLTSLVAAFEV
jgi:methyl-accepting chemotaxis protein